MSNPRHPETVDLLVTVLDAAVLCSPELTDVGDMFEIKPRSQITKY